MGITFPTDSAWKQVKIGAGGYITGIDIAPDGTMVGRTDTYGAYIWNGSGWDQLVTAASMPSGIHFTGGAYEIRISSSNTNIFYMSLHDGIYKTVDRGQTWTKTSFPITTIDPNGGHRMDGQKMAIDPSNPTSSSPVRRRMACGSPVTAEAPGPRSPQCRRAPAPSTPA